MKSDDMLIPQIPADLPIETKNNFAKKVQSVRTKIVNVEKKQ